MKTREKGYVLLLTLVLLALAASAMTGICLRSFNRAVEASQAQIELQRRWAGVSCRATFLPRAEQILVQSEQTTRLPCAVCRLDVNLGNQGFELVFADEDAKLNICTVYQKLGRERTQQCLEDFVPHAATNSSSFRLAPSQEGTFTSFGQIFDKDAPSTYIANGNMELAATRALTLWGSGRVNFRRASIEALASLEVFGLDKAQELADARGSDPSVTLENAMSALDWQADKRALARQFLTDGSGCHSLWILPRDKQGSETGVSFSVKEDSSDAMPWVFTW